LIDGGPEAIRLQDIAADVGISHPAILHHFAGREGVIEALVTHAIRGLQDDLLRVIGARRVGDSREQRAARTLAMLEQVAHVFVDRGYARLLAGLILSGANLDAPMQGIFRELADAMHASRVQRRREDGRPPPRMEDTLFAIVMVSVGLFGDALFGRYARLSLGLPDDAETVRRFRRWLADNAEGTGRGATS
jgi:AcrR family transcriptional regulator